MRKKMYDSSVVDVKISDLNLDEDTKSLYRGKPRLIETYIERITAGEYTPEKIVIIKPNKVIDFNTLSSAWITAWKEVQVRHKDNPPSSARVNDGEWHIQILYIIPCDDCKYPLRRGCRCIQNIESSTKPV